MPETIDEKVRSILDQPDDAAVPTNSIPLTSKALGITFVDNSGPKRSTLGIDPPAIISSLVARQANREKFVLENQDPGTPLDLESGVTGWERINLNFRRAQEDRLRYLQGRYGEDKVRLATDGDLIVRVIDHETGKPKDVKANEDKLSAKDFLSLVGSAPEIAAGMIGGAAAKSIPVLGKLKGVLGAARDIVSTAVAAETAGGIKDAGIRAMEGAPVNLEEIASERGKLAVADTAFGAVGSAVGGFVKWIRDPLKSTRGTVQFDALGAQKYFKDKYGVDVPLTIGESTGNPLLSRSETFIEKLPGGSTPLKDLRMQQEEKLRQLQRLMIGESDLSAEEAGRAMVDTLKQKTAPAQEAVDAARTATTAEASSEIKKSIADATTPTPQLYKTEVGKAVRDKVVALRDSAKTKSDELYAAVKASPGGSDKAFATKGLADEAEKILSSLPSAENMVTEPTGLLDQFGRELTSTSNKNVPMKEFVPPNILSRLKTLSSLKEGKVGLSDLQQMRREVYDDIEKGQGVPGLGTHYLSDIGKALTKAIDDGVSALPSGELKSALSAANKHYKEQVIPFNRIGITELFRAADESGVTGNFALTKKIISDPDKFLLFKQTLGEKSPEFVNLKRTIADDLLEASKKPGSDAIDADSFIKNLDSFQKNYREISDEVFGKNVSSLIKSAQVLGTAQKEIGDVPKEELAALLSSSNKSVLTLRHLANAQAKRDELYKNSILKAITDGKLEEINPAKFVSSFVKNGKDSDIRQVLGMLSDKPEVVESIRQKLVEDILQTASRTAKAGDINKVISGDPTHIVSGIKLTDMFKNETFRDNVKTVLGSERFEDLSQYIRLQTAPENKEIAFSAAGGLAAGQMIANLTRMGPLKYVTDAIRHSIEATLLTNKAARNWLGQISQDTALNKTLDTTMAIMGSGPVLRAISSEFGDNAPNVVKNIKSSIDRWAAESQHKNDPKKQADDRDAKVRKFLESP